MILKDLLNGINSNLSTKYQDILVTGIGLDSRYIRKNEIFVALSGGNAHGLIYITDAIIQGALVIFCDKLDKNHPLLPINCKIPILFVSDLETKLVILANRMYPKAKQKRIIAITGTNGKSSIAWFIVQLAYYLKQDFASIGTLGVQKMNLGGMVNLAQTNMTTPDIFCLYKILNQLSQNTIILEASSHSLAQNRLAGLVIDIAIFSNLSQDHLDYHHNMADYFACKQLLFTRLELKTAIINIDDNYGANIKTKAKKITYSLSDVKQLKINNCGFDFVLNNQIVTTHLLGVFNIFNLLASIACLENMGFTLANIIPHIDKITTPTGRMQHIYSKKDLKANIWVDFAHTPDALAQVLTTLKTHNPKDKIVLVFGCGGNRDKYKRAKMGKIADKLADKIIITNDNPRNEPPEQIIADISKGIKTQNPHIMLDRKNAIEYAIDLLKENECLLIAGKGHETLQHIGDDKITCNDTKIVIDYVR